MVIHQNAGLAGSIMAPFRDRPSSFSSIMLLNGVSLGTIISFLCSFSVTAAALVMSVSTTPDDIFTHVDWEQEGQMIMASTMLEPEAIGANISLSSKCSSALEIRSS